MAQDEVVRLQLDTNRFEAGVQRAANAFKKFGKEAGQTAEGIANRISTTRAAIIGFGFARIFSSAIEAMKDFGEEMSVVQAVTQATGAEFDKLRKKAAELGETTRFTAREAAEGMEFLARAGFDAAEILESITHVLDLAAAGKLSLARAADIASNVLSTFNLTTAETQRAVDVLAGVAASANTNVEQLAEALKFVGPIASGLGISLEETAAGIAVLSNRGQQASLAGTGLRRILSSLTSPTTNAKKAIKELGIELDDLNPAINTPIEIIRRLVDATITADDAFQIFRDRGAAAILNVVGASGELERLTEEFKNLEGAAGKAADVAEDNLAGAFRELNSAVQGVFIALGESGIQDILIKLTDAVTSFVREISEFVKMNSTMAASLAGLVAGFAAFFATVAGFAILLTTIAAAGGGVVAALGAMAVAVAAFTGVWVKNIQDAKSVLEDFEVFSERTRRTVENLGEALEENKKQFDEFGNKIEEVEEKQKSLKARIQERVSLEQVTMWMVALKELGLTATEASVMVGSLFQKLRGEGRDVELMSQAIEGTVNLKVALDQANWSSGDLRESLEETMRVLIQGSDEQAKALLNQVFEIRRAGRAMSEGLRRNLWENIQKDLEQNPIKLATELVLKDFVPTETDRDFKKIEASVDAVLEKVKEFQNQLDQGVVAPVLIRGLSDEFKGLIPNVNKAIASYESFTKTVDKIQGLTLQLRALEDILTVAEFDDDIPVAQLNQALEMAKRTKKELFELNAEMEKLKEGVVDENLDIGDRVYKWFDEFFKYLLDNVKLLAVEILNLIVIPIAYAIENTVARFKKMFGDDDFVPRTFKELAEDAKVPIAKALGLDEAEIERIRQERSRRFEERTPAEYLVPGGTAQVARDFLHVFGRGRTNPYSAPGSLGLEVTPQAQEAVQESRQERVLKDVEEESRAEAERAKEARKSFFEEMKSFIRGVFSGFTRVGRLEEISKVDDPLSLARKSGIDLSGLDTTDNLAFKESIIKLASARQLQSDSIEDDIKNKIEMYNESAKSGYEISKKDTEVFLDLVKDLEGDLKDSSKSQANMVKLFKALNKIQVEGYENQAKDAQLNLDEVQGNLNELKRARDGVFRKLSAGDYERSLDATDQGIPILLQDYLDRFSELVGKKMVNQVQVLENTAQAQLVGKDEDAQKRVMQDLNTKIGKVVFEGTEKIAQEAESVYEEFFGGQSRISAALSSSLGSKQAIQELQGKRYDALRTSMERVDEDTRGQIADFLRKKDSVIFNELKEDLPLDQLIVKLKEGRSEFTSPEQAELNAIIDARQAALKKLLVDEQKLTIEDSIKFSENILIRLHEGVRRAAKEAGDVPKFREFGQKVVSERVRVDKQEAELRRLSGDKEAVPSLSEVDIADLRAAVNDEANRLSIKKQQIPIDTALSGLKRDFGQAERDANYEEQLRIIQKIFGLENDRLDLEEKRLQIGLKSEIEKDAVSSKIEDDRKNLEVALKLDERRVQLASEETRLKEVQGRLEQIAEDPLILDQVTAGDTNQVNRLNELTDERTELLKEQERLQKNIVKLSDSISEKQREQLIQGYEKARLDAEEGNNLKGQKQALEAMVLLRRQNVVESIRQADNAKTTSQELRHRLESLREQKKLEQDQKQRDIVNLRIAEIGGAEGTSTAIGEVEVRSKRRQDVLDKQIRSTEVDLENVATVEAIEEAQNRVDDIQTKISNSGKETVQQFETIGRLLEELRKLYIAIFGYEQAIIEAKYEAGVITEDEKKKQEAALRVRYNALDAANETNILENNRLTTLRKIEEAHVEVVKAQELAKKNLLNDREAAKLLLPAITKELEAVKEAAAAHPESTELQERVLITERQKEDLDFMANANIFEIWGRELKKFASDLKGDFGLFKTLARDTARQMSRSFQQFFFDTFKNNINSLKDILKSFENFAAQIASRILSEFVTQGVVALLGKSFTAIGGFFPGAGAGGGGGFQGPPAPLPPGVHGPPGLPGFQHGGVVPGFTHEGTLITATPGEGIVSRRGMRALEQLNQGFGIGNSQVNVNVYNNAEGVEVETQENRSRPGQIDIAMMINKAVADDVRKGGAVAKAVQGRFGLGIQPVQR